VRSLVALTLTAAVALVPALAAARPLELHDLRGIVSISDPQISPDGKRVAYVTRRADYVKDHYRGELIVLDLATHARTTYTRERRDVSSPAWSPSGDRLAYLATPIVTPEPSSAKPDAPPVPPAPQIHVAARAGGDPQTITAAKNGVESYAWSHDGKWFAFVTEDDAPNQKAIDAHEDSFEVVGDAWTAHGAPHPAHLWIVSAAGGTARRMTSGTWSVNGTPAWSPDGRSIVFARSPDAYPGHTLGSTIAVVDVRSATVRSLGAGEGPSFSHDGTRIVFRAPSPVAATQTDIGVMRADGTQRSTAPARLDRNASDAVFAPDDHSIIAGANDGTLHRLFRIRLDGNVQAYPIGERSANGAASVAAGGTLVFAGATTSDPSELYVLRSGEKQPERLTNDNAFLARYALGTNRTMPWRGDDGVMVDGVVTEPAGMNRAHAYPLVLLVHGGPTSASLATFSGLAELMAARGWIVFQPNYRGSDNLGAQAMRTAIPHVASVAGRDVLRGVDYLEREDPIDRTRIGVSGWSAGGLMTSWLITHDTRWRAAMTGAAVNDWTKLATMSDADSYAWELLGGGKPYASEATRALYDAESPITYVANVRTPLLIMTDAGDQRVPTPLSYEFYHEVRATGTPVEMVVFPVNGHNPTDPIRSEDRTKRWVEWFARHF
jgi:dipeptidyl aminopeptidase/acylaminoacyl peptidase